MHPGIQSSGVHIPVGQGDEIPLVNHVLEDMSPENTKTQLECTGGQVNRGTMDGTAVGGAFGFGIHHGGP